MSTFGFAWPERAEPVSLFCIRVWVEKRCFPCLRSFVSVMSLIRLMVSWILFRVRFIAVCFSSINFARGQINLTFVKFNFNSLRWKVLINSINSVGFFILDQAINLKCNFDSLHPINYFIFAFKFIEYFKFGFWLNFSYPDNLPNFLLSAFHSLPIFSFNQSKRSSTNKSYYLFELKLSLTAPANSSCSPVESAHWRPTVRIAFASGTLECCLACSRTGWGQKQIHSRVPSHWFLWPRFAPWWWTHGPSWWCLAEEPSAPACNHWIGTHCWQRTGFQNHFQRKVGLPICFPGWIDHFEWFLDIELFINFRPGNSKMLGTRCFRWSLFWPQAFYFCWICSDWICVWSHTSSGLVPAELNRLIHSFFGRLCCLNSISKTSDS